MAVVAPAAAPREEERPIAGFVISLIAGIIILINGLLISTISAFVFWTLGMGLSTILIALGLLFGILVIVGAVLMYRGARVAGGVLVILFGLFSIVIGGGFIIGLILAIVGGALGLAGK